MEFKINKPTVHWTDEQIKQISKDMTAYFKKRFVDEVLDVEILNFRAENPDYNGASTFYVEIEYIFYTPWWDEDEDNPDPRDGKPQTMGTAVFADGEQILSSPVYNVFTSQERYFINHIVNFFSEPDYSEACPSM